MIWTTHDLQMFLSRKPMLRRWQKVLKLGANMTDEKKKDEEKEQQRRDKEFEDANKQIVHDVPIYTA